MFLIFFFLPDTISHCDRPAFMKANFSCKTDCPEEGANNSKDVKGSINNETILK